MISKQPKRIIHMKKTTGTMLLLAGICAALCYTSCKSAAGEPHEEEINYVATTPVQVDTLVTRDYVAQIHAIRHIELRAREDRKSTRLNSSHVKISYAVFCLKKKTKARKPGRQGR